MRRPRRVPWWAAAIAVLAATACSGGDGDGNDPTPEALAEQSVESAPRLIDVADQVGVDFTHGAFRWQTAGDPVAMMGGGVCWLDADGDGRLDLYAVNSYAEAEFRRLEAEAQLPVNRLFRNDGSGFTDISAGSGADLTVRGNGCVAADLDLDGATDLYVTTARQNVLLWGNGDGTFTEGAQAAGVDAYGWHSGAAVGDLDLDGLPDLYVAGYVDMNHPRTEADQGFPNTHEGVRDLVYLNQGPSAGGRPTFRESADELGVDPGSGYGLGALLTDVDGDRDLDIYVANDTNPNLLYINEPAAGPGGLGFTLLEAGERAAVADAESGMGVAGDDFDGDGRGDLFVTNFGDQTHALLENRSGPGSPSFTDGLVAGGVGDLGVGETGWGTGFADLDLDADLDLLIANGFVPVTDLEADAQLLEALENRPGDAGDAAFEPFGAALGLDQVGPLNARGLATADFDDDGDVDVAVNSIGSPLVLLENRGAAGNWIEVAPAEHSPGAVVTVRLSDGRELRRELHAGSSYLSSEDPRALFGLGPQTAVARLRVDWPGGGSTAIDDVEANQVVTIGREAP